MSANYYTITKLSREVVTNAIVCFHFALCVNVYIYICVCSLYMGMTGYIKECQYNREEYKKQKTVSFTPEQIYLATKNSQLRR